MTRHPVNERSATPTDTVVLKCTPLVSIPVPSPPSIQLSGSMMGVNSIGFDIGAAFQKQVAAGKDRKSFQADFRVGVDTPTALLFVKLDNLRESLPNFPNWPAGTFDTAFHDLVLSSSLLAGIPLQGIPERLAALQPKGEQEIEVIGLKISAGEVTRWGVMFLLAVQCYFWIHLHEFTRKVDPASPGRDVAWIGVYHSLAASLASVLSACLLPVAALWQLSRRLPTVLPESLGSHGSAAVVYGVPAIGMLIATLTAIRLSRLRSSLHLTAPLAN